MPASVDDILDPQASDASARFTAPAPEPAGQVRTVFLEFPGTDRRRCNRRALTGCRRPAPGGARSQVQQRQYRRDLPSRYLQTAWSGRRPAEFRPCLPLLEDPLAEHQKVLQALDAQIWPPKRAQEPRSAGSGAGTSSALIRAIIRANRSSIALSSQVALRPSPSVSSTASRYGAARARRASVPVDKTPGFPDRIETARPDARRTALLVNYTHQDADTPYRASHAISVAEGRARPAASSMRSPRYAACACCRCAPSMPPT